MSLLIIILLALVFSAFFSGMEIAFVTANKLRLEINRKQDLFPSRIISIFTRDPGQFIATMLVGNNISLVVCGTLMAYILEPLIRPVISSYAGMLTLQTLITTFIILIPAEFLPKSIFRRNPNVFLSSLAIPVLFFYIIFYPIARFSIWLSDFVLGFFLKVDINKKEHKVVFGKTDLDHFVNQLQTPERAEEAVENEIRIFRNALDFSEVKLRECMVPRTEMVAVEVDSDVDDLRQKFIETGLSRILVYKDNIDNIIGYIKSSQLFDNPATISDSMTTVPVVPETMPASRLLENFMKLRKNIAVVVDEFGGTSGIVTSEDIIEEIFGEIVDEHDKTYLEERVLAENEFILSGRLEIDYLNEKYRLGIEESDEYNTLAGFILLHHKNMPLANESFSIGQLKFKVLKITATRIELVHLEIESSD
ncbi:MAG: hemolysin family protein [Bacteroidia bacterium]|nr:hemolysin family protein [Bacteroidia bacterium]